LGSVQGGRRVGTVGHAGCFSFFPSKNLGGFGDGGAVVTNDPALAESVAELRAHGATSPHHHIGIGTNSRLDEIQAALLQVKLPWLDQWIAQRRGHASTYQAALRSVPAVSVPVDRSGGGHTFGQYTVRVGAGRRDELRNHLRTEGIMSAVYYPRPLHLQPALGHLGYRLGDLPVAEEAAASVLSLPMFPDLTADEIARVTAAVRRFTT
jgi:dTDP-4-amino-4,6-dideoxygalactose transaminase